MGQRDDAQQAFMIRPGEQRRGVSRQQRRHHRVIFQGGLLGHHALCLVDGEGELEGDRILRPQAAVVVEHGDPLRRGHEVGRTLVGGALDEGDQRRARGTVVPGRQWIRRGSCATRHQDYQHCQHGQPGAPQNIPTIHGLLLSTPGSSLLSGSSPRWLLLNSPAGLPSSL